MGKKRDREERGMEKRERKNEKGREVGEERGRNRGRGKIGKRAGRVSENEKGRQAEGREENGENLPEREKGE